MFVLVRTF